MKKVTVWMLVILSVCAVSALASGSRYYSSHSKDGEKSGDDKKSKYYSSKSNEGEKSGDRSKSKYGSWGDWSKSKDKSSSYSSKKLSMSLFSGKSSKLHSYVDCVRYPCQHGGECCRGYKYSRCLCSAGYKGKRCEIEIKECASNPCKSGATCMDQVNGYTCILPDSTKSCASSQTLNPCSSHPCHNGGSCSSYKGKYKCKCRPGFGGRDCSTNIDECASYPCSFGSSCIDKINGYVCKCAPGYQGKNCDKKIAHCTSRSCKNGGTCVVNKYKKSWACVCKPGFTGQRCENAIDDCSSHPCKNGGSCCDFPNGYMCQCAGGWTGRLCEKRDLDMSVKEGEMSFEEDGDDDPKSKRYSRRPHVSNDRCGVAIGRGYDLRHRKPEQVIKDLRAVGMNYKDALWLSRACGLKGSKARYYIKKHKLYDIEISKRQQKLLFQLDYPRRCKYAKSVVEKYTKRTLHFSKMNKFSRELAVDIINRGEFSMSDKEPERKRCSKRLQDVFDKKSLQAVKDLMMDSDFWLKRLKISKYSYQLRRKKCLEACKKSRYCK